MENNRNSKGVRHYCTRCKKKRYESLVCARKRLDQQQLDGKLFIGPDVMIKNEGGNLCRACGTDISDEPGRLYCSECEDDPNVQGRLRS